MATGSQIRLLSEGFRKMGNSKEISELGDCGRSSERMAYVLPGGTKMGRPHSKKMERLR